MRIASLMSLQNEQIQTEDAWSPLELPTIQLIADIQLTPNGIRVVDRRCPDACFIWFAKPHSLIEYRARACQYQQIGNSDSRTRDDGTQS
jgi:hypothetical protein